MNTMILRSEMAVESSMLFDLILAHGALGWWDEMIFAAVVLLFIGFMGFAWLRSRNFEPSFDDEEGETQSAATENRESSDRFQLD